MKVLYEKKIAATYLACFIIVSGLVFAFNSGTIITYFRGLGNGIYTVTENGYIQDVEMERIQKSNSIK